MFCNVNSLLPLAIIMAVILTDFPECTRVAWTDRWSKVNIPSDCVSMQVEVVGVVDVTKALQNISIATCQPNSSPVCACVWTSGTWSKVNTPADSESIQVEMVGVVDVAKALESITAIC